MGFETGEPVPATDDFLNKAQKTWYPDAPMDKIDKFTVENTSHINFKGEGGITRCVLKNGLYTGRSNVYFNKDVAFTSAKELYKTMGHELVHVSQISELAGSTALAANSPIRDIMEYHAYSYQSIIGVPSMGSPYTS